jgi:hypothetical protein
MDAQSQMDAQSLDDEQQLEVNLVYEDLLQSTGGILREVLEEIDLSRDGVSTVDELINLIANKLAQRGMGHKQIEKTLADLFGGLYTAESGPSGQPGARWPLLLLSLLAVAGLISFMIARGRRRRKRDNRVD